MPTPGLSLVGFMEQERTLEYLCAACIPPDPSRPALRAAWQSARALLGEAYWHAGDASIEEIHGERADLEALRHAPAAVPFFADGWEPRLVQIDPLLAFQVHVDQSKADAACREIVGPATLADALPMCLPLTSPPPPPIFQSGQPNDPRQLQSLVFKSPSLDLRVLEKGFFQDGKAGVRLWVAPALAQVVRFQGRCYLRNGFHRAVGLRMRGLEAIPCLFREATGFADIAEGPPATFGQDLLESANPPTVGHYVHGRCFPVTLRRFSRIIHVSWAEYVIQEE